MNDRNIPVTEDELHAYVDGELPAERRADVEAWLAAYPEDAERVQSWRAMTEWPAWHPTPGEISRLGVPTYVAPGPDNPMGSRAMYLYSGGKDTLFRIHGTNQPEYIGASISSGCIRLTNEDAIDLYNRVKVGTIVVVLEPKHGDSPYNSRLALGGSQTGQAGSY